jgi:outer membrane lipoprotein LolB
LIEWLRGRAWPEAPSQARAGGFDQLGWTIDLARYATDGVLLARREQAPAVSVRVRLDRAP